MKTKKQTKILLIAIVALFVGNMNVMAQDAKTKAGIAKIREAYAKAQKLVENEQKSQKTNYQVFESWTADPDGNKLHYTNEFFFKYPPEEDELGLYPPILTFVKQKAGNFYQEYLYNEEGNLIFTYVYFDPKGKSNTQEYRYYYLDGSIWKIERVVDVKTKKVLSENQEGMDYDDEAESLGYIRESANIMNAFNSLNAQYD